MCRAGELGGGVKGPAQGPYTCDSSAEAGARTGNLPMTGTQTSHVPPLYKKKRVYYFLDCEFLY